MDSKVNYTVVGAFVIVLSIALIVLFFWLSSFRHDKNYDTYVTYMHEEVTGLSVQAPVRFNGVPVGYVKSIELDPNNPQLVKLTLKIQEGTPVSTSTIATLSSQGLTGGLYVGLKAQTINAPMLVAQQGQKYPVIPSQPSLFTQLSKVLPQVTKNVEAIGQRISDVLSVKNRQAIVQILQSVKKFTQTIADNSTQLDRIVKSLDKVMVNTEKASRQFPNVMTELNQTMKAARKTASHVNRASIKINKMLANSDVMVQNFSDQLMPATQVLIQRLTELGTNLNQVSQQLSRNPSMLIRGKQLPTPGPGEK